MAYSSRIKSQLNQHMLQSVDTALQRITDAVDEHNLDAVFALVSGGDASITLMHLAMMHPRFAGVIHIDTLTGITDTDAWKTGQPESIATRYVTEQARQHNVKLIVKTPFTRYEQLIVKNGFPGAPMHQLMYQFLKERPLMQAKKDAKEITGPKFGFVSGVSMKDSIRRMGHVGLSQKNKTGVWINPCYNWSSYEFGMLQSVAVTNRNPVSVQFGMSGECGCGAYASPTEAKVIERIYPKQAERIKAWETLVTASRAMFNHELKFCRWGHAQGKRLNDNQLELPLCVSCQTQVVDREIVMRKIQKQGME